MMSLLFIADPNSIHDCRWINFFATKGNVKCFVLPRICHVSGKSNGNLLQTNVQLLPGIIDHSTVRPLRTLRQVLRIRKIIHKFNIDILHILYAEPNALWAAYRWFFKLPIIITTRGTDILKTIPEFFNQKSFLKKLVGLQYKWAFRQSVVTCTSAGQIEVLRRLNLRINPVLIRTGVDFALIQNANEKIAFDMGIDKPFVLMPRNMKPLYNHLFTLDAIVLLPSTITERFCFIFLNSDTIEQAYLESVRKKAKLINADIRFYPSLPHVSLLSLYKESSLVVMNPISDGSPVTAMEAMACKVPVILPPLSYDEEVFSDAYYFSEWTPSSLAEKVQEVLISDHSAGSIKIERSFDNVLNFGSTDLQMLKLEKIYKSLLYGA